MYSRWELIELNLSLCLITRRDSNDSLMLNERYLKGESLLGYYYSSCYSADPSRPDCIDDAKLLLFAD